jgi:hypothetical protein
MHDPQDCVHFVRILTEMTYMTGFHAASDYVRILDATSKICREGKYLGLEEMQRSAINHMTPSEHDNVCRDGHNTVAAYWMRHNRRDMHRSQLFEMLPIHNRVYYVVTGAWTNLMSKLPF